MKQTITPEQLSQLTDKGKERLIQYVWKIEEEEAKSIFPDSFITVDKPSIHDLCLNIGQIIEFLDSQNDIKEIDDPRNRDECYAYWRVGTSERAGNVYMTWEKDMELCDALWSACVEVLNKE